MKTARSIIVLIWIGNVTGCGFPNHAERKYLARIEKSQTTFRVPLSLFDSVWSRAKRFITTYSSRSITIANDSVISSEPSGISDRMLDTGCGYKVTAKNIHDTTAIDITASFSSSLLSDPNAPDNLYILIDYMKTGSLPFPELISR
jgi:hypothetical protein